MAEQTGPDLPSFEAGRIYLVKGATLNALVRQIKANKPKAVTNGGLQVVSQGEDGTYLQFDPANIINVQICVNGAPVTYALVTLGPVT